MTTTPTPGSTRFHNLPEAKRERIEKAAAAEFATKGYSEANTNTIAAAAGISVGALFAYFPKKKDLYNHITQRGIGLMEASVGHILATKQPVFSIIEEIVTLIVDTCRHERETVQLYQLLTAPGDRQESQHWALELERYTSQNYVQLMRRGQQEGDVRTDLSASALAFHMDNTFITLQYSLASDYFEQRRSMYGPSEADTELVAQTVALLRGAIGAQKENA